MKALKTGYAFAMVSLLTLVVVLAIAAFYPAPKKFSYPASPRATNYDSSSDLYQRQQQQYEQDLKKYEQGNKSYENQRRVWGHTVFIICLIAGGVMVAGGMVLARISPIFSASALFAGFILLVFGSGLTSYYAESTVYSFMSSDIEADVSGYKQFEFWVSLAAAAVGSVLGFVKFKKD